MSKNRNFEIYERKILLDVFKKTINLFALSLGNKAFRIGNPFNAAAFDASMVGLALRLQKGNIDSEKFRVAYNELYSNPVFIEKTKGGTSDEKQLQDRIQIAIDKFSIL